MHISWLITGALPAMSIPGALFSLRTIHPSMIVSPYMTRSAGRLVTPEVLGTFAGRNPRLDTWEESTLDREVTSPPIHIHLEDNHDAFVVAPASLSFMARFVSYDCSTPFALSLQCTRKPIILAPCLPPGGIDSIAYRSILIELEKWDNVHILPPIPTTSASVPQMSSSGFGDLSRLINFILEKTRDLDGKDF